MNGLGVRQRRMLVLLAGIGQGRWPVRWRTQHDHRRIMASLHAKGLVSGPDPATAELTEQGRLLASWLTGPAKPRETLDNNPAESV